MSLDCIFTLAYFMFIVDCYVIIILAIFKVFLQWHLCRQCYTIYHNCSHFYPAYPPYIFTLSVLESTQLTSVLDVNGKIVPIRGVRVCRGSEAQFHPLLTLALDRYKWPASHPDHLWLDIMLEIICRHKQSLQLCEILIASAQILTVFLRFLMYEIEIFLCQ
jgi:hypothetical protein